MLTDSLQSDLRIGMTPNMNPDQRHGSILFEVSGFGQVRRDFQVDAPDVLATDTSKHVNDLVDQVMLLDNTLPKKKINCRPINIDIRVGGVRRIYECGTLKVILEQTIG